MNLYRDQQMEQRRPFNKRLFGGRTHGIEA